MLPSTIISGFKTCGVYPLNPSTFIATVEDPAVSDKLPSPNKNLKFIPLYSPSAPVKGRCARVFSHGEEMLFQRRHENGYDLPDDTRYISWLQINHRDEAQRLCSLLNDPVLSSSDSSSDKDLQTSEAVRTLQPQSTLSKFLDYPEPPARTVPPTKKKSAKVLTSAENLKLMEEKESNRN